MSDRSKPPPSCSPSHHQAFYVSALLSKVILLRASKWLQPWLTQPNPSYLPVNDKQRILTERDYYQDDAQNHYDS